MSKLRINNATVFITVFGACLGLMVAGASSQAHQTASSVLSEITSATSAQLSYRHASRQAQKRTEAHHARPLPLASQSETSAAKVLYRNTNPLTASQKILVITRLARASLEARAA